jgi:hypothetical protein
MTESGISSTTNPTDHRPLKKAQLSVNDVFHAAALRAGGIDNGQPGLLAGAEGCPPGHYAAFVLDPDGNNIEAVFRES